MPLGATLLQRKEEADLWRADLEAGLVPAAQVPAVQAFIAAAYAHDMPLSADRLRMPGAPTEKQQAAAAAAAARAAAAAAGAGE